MKHKLQYKITAWMILLATVVLTVVGALLMGYTALDYYRRFDGAIARAYDAQQIASLQQKFAQTPNAATVKEDIDGHAGVLSAFGQVRWCLIREQTVVYTEPAGGSLPESHNLELVQAGKESSGSSILRGVADFALQLDATHILYIWDDGTALMTQLGRLLVLFLPVLAASWVLAALLAMLLARAITRPIVQLTRRVEDLSQGLPIQPLTINRSDEIGTLHRVFDEMSMQLQQTILLLTQIIDELPMPVCALREGKILHQNRLFSKCFSDLSKLPFALQKGAGETQIGEQRYTWQITEFYGGDLLIVLQDITPFVKLDQARRSFVADVSHELKTPLTVLRTYTETLADPTPPDAATCQSFLQTMLKECDRMNHMVGQLLTLSQLEGAPEVLDGVTDLVMVAKEVTATLAVQIEEKQQSLTMNLCKKAPVAATEEECRRILTNLLTNAIRYGGQEGKILLEITHKKGLTKLVVTDYGVGIDAAHLPHIFEKFYRVDKARSRATGGTGLGLSIVKEILLLRGGEVIVESNVGEFTRFTVTLWDHFERKEK